MRSLPQEFGRRHAGTGHADAIEVGRGDRRGVGEHEAELGIVERQAIATPVHDTADDRARAGNRHLLAHDRAHRHLGTVDRAWYAEPGS